MTDGLWSRLASFCELIAGRVCHENEAKSESTKQVGRDDSGGRFDKCAFSGWTSGCCHNQVFAGKGCLTNFRKPQHDHHVVVELAAIPETKVSFVQGGSSPSGVIVHFSAVVSTNGTMLVRARLDGGAAGVAPSEMQFITNGGRATQSVSFIFPSVSPGDRSIVKQWASFLGSSVVTIDQRHTIVHHK